MNSAKEIKIGLGLILLALSMGCLSVFHREKDYYYPSSPSEIILAKYHDRVFVVEDSSRGIDMFNGLNIRLPDSLDGSILRGFLVIEIELDKKGKFLGIRKIAQELFIFNERRRPKTYLVSENFEKSLDSFLSDICSQLHISKLKPHENHIKNQELIQTAFLQVQIWPESKLFDQLNSRGR